MPIRHNFLWTPPTIWGVEGDEPLADDGEVWIAYGQYDSHEPPCVEVRLLGRPPQRREIVLMTVRCCTVEIDVYS